MVGRQATLLRMCVSCRNKNPQNELIRITVVHKSNHVVLNHAQCKAQGRSSYLCRSKTCVERALKGPRLKYALEGRKVKGAENRRVITWPLEPQLIHEIYSRCPEAQKTCQNTERTEDAE